MSDTAAGSVLGSDLRAVLLAAGSGERLGGQPKALVRIDGEPLVRRQVRVLQAAGITEVTVVLGAGAAQARAALADLVVAVVENPAHRDGQASSVMAGLSALAAGEGPVLVALVDQPLLGAGDVRALIGAYAARGAARAVVPEFAGQRGNPVIVAGSVVAAVLAERPRAALRGWLDGHSAEVLRWSAGSEAYTFDLDTPADVERFVARSGCTVQLPFAATGVLTDG